MRKYGLSPAFDLVELAALLDAPIARLAVPIHTARPLAHHQARGSPRLRCSPRRAVVAERACGEVTRSADGRCSFCFVFRDTPASRMRQARLSKQNRPSEGEPQARPPETLGGACARGRPGARGHGSARRPPGALAFGRCLRPMRASSSTSAPRLGPSTPSGTGTAAGWARAGKAKRACRPSARRRGSIYRRRERKRCSCASAPRPTLPERSSFTSMAKLPVKRE